MSAKTNKLTTLAILTAILVVIALVPLSIILSRRTSSGGQSLSAIDKHSLLAVAADMPPGFELWKPSHALNKDPFPPNTIEERWRGQTMDVTKPVSPRNKITQTVSVRVQIGSTAAEAWKAVTPGIGGPFTQAVTVSGSYSGRPIGDTSVRGGGPPSIGATLWFLRGPVAFEIKISGRPSAHNYPQEAERLAMALVERADASMALSQSAPSTTSLAGKSIPVRIVNGVTVAELNDYADAVGAVAQFEIANSTAELRKGNRVLKINVGRREAWLNGKSQTLAFPALRHGLDRVYCPLDTLREVR